jgi:Kef-type K+ transport system membrane component KefB/nucleotide-binding universal stress UspA family protein
MPFLADGRWSLPVTDPVLTFALIMLVILIAPLIAQRLRGPGVIGLILAGILLGPNALNLFARDGAILLLGSVGLLYIMFQAGLELDLHLFRRYRSHSLAFGTTTYVVPQVIGTAVAVLILGFDWPAAILLGCMFGSHTLLTYPIASRLGLARNPAVTTAVGGSIITDTLALLVLAVVARSAKGVLDLGFWSTLALSLALFASLVWWGLPLVARWFFRSLPAEGSAHFVFLLASVYLCAALAVSAGVEPILGAFLAGLALNRLVPDQSVLMNRVQFAGSWLFIPFFLLSVGMLVDPRVFVERPESWLVAVAMVTTVIATKLLAAWVSGRLLGYDRAEGAVMFGLTVNQAAGTLAAVVVGLRVGIFDETVLNGAVAMILATCLLGPWATQRYGRVLALRQDADTGHDEAPQRILVPLRNPEAADAIMDVAFMIRETDSPEPLCLLTVVQESTESTDEVAAGERMLGHAVMHAVAAEVPVMPATRIDTNAAAGIMRAIRELRIGTVVMGWTGTSPARNRIFGSVLDELLEQCPQQFVVCRLRAPLNTARRLVVALAPFAHREAGFVPAMALIKRMAGRGGMRLAISGSERDCRQAQPILAAITPAIEPEWIPVASVALWGDGTGPKLRPDDLFVLLAARRHQVSWQPSIDRLPQQMLARIPDLGMVVVYPRADRIGPRPGPAEPDADALSLEELFAPERMTLRRPVRDLDELVGTMLETQFSDARQPTAQSIRAELGRIGQAPIEVAPSVLLLHATNDEIQRPLGFVGSSREPFLDGSGRPISAALLLVTPVGFPAAAHLKHLARIGRALHDPEASRRLVGASHPSDVVAILAAGDAP